MSNSASILDLSILTLTCTVALVMGALAAAAETPIINIINWASNDEPPVKVTGPGILDVKVWRQKQSMTVHLVNLTNAMMMKGPFREFIRIGEQKLQIKNSTKYEGAENPPARQRQKS